MRVHRRKHWFEKLAEALNAQADAELREKARRIVFDGLKYIHRQKHPRDKQGRFV